MAETSTFYKTILTRLKTCDFFLDNLCCESLKYLVFSCIILYLWLSNCISKHVNDGYESLIIFGGSRMFKQEPVPIVEGRARGCDWGSKRGF